MIDVPEQAQGGDASIGPPAAFGAGERPQLQDDPEDPEMSPAHPAATDEPALDLMLDEGPADVGRSRRAVREAFTSMGHDAEVVDAAVSVTSELVTNAVLHGGGAVRLTVRLIDGGARLEVTDRNPQPPRPSRYGSDATTGRGLLLVAALATAWGFRVDGVDDGSKAVWADFTIGSERPLPEEAPQHRVEAASGVVEVRWSAVPIATYLLLQQQNDALQRDVDLLLIGADDGLVPPVPDELLRLCRDMREQFGRPTSLHRGDVSAAADRGDTHVDLAAWMPHDAAPAARRYVDLLESIEAHAARGHLLAPSPTPDVIALRRWFVDHLAEQLRQA